MSYKPPSVTAPNPISATVQATRKASFQPTASDSRRGGCADSFSLAALLRSKSPQRFQSIAAQPHPSHDISKITASVLEEYDQLIGSWCREVFERQTLPLAMEMLGHDRERAQEILIKLIDKASYLKPREIDEFWRCRVTTDTFAFQKHYDELRSPDCRYIPGFVFHITERDLLQRIDELVPECMRRRIEYEEELADLFYDCHIVNTARGTIDELAQYLTGHAFLHWEVKYGQKDKVEHIPDLLQEEGVDYLCSFAVAAARKDKCTYSGQHEIETLYDLRQGFVDVYESKERVRIEHVIRIPLTILTDKQEAQLQREGGYFFKQRIESGIAEPYVEDMDTPEIAGAIYAAVKHQELALKYALLKFVEKISATSNGSS